MCQRTAQGKLPHTKSLIQSSEKVHSIVAHPLCIYVLTTDMRNDKVNTMVCEIVIGAFRVMVKVFLAT